MKESDRRSDDATGEVPGLASAARVALCVIRCLAVGAAAVLALWVLMKVIGR